MNKLKGASVALLLIFIGGCGSTPTQPDLKRLYGAGSGAVDQPPVVLVPGIMGSRLRDPVTSKEVWPGTLRKLLFSNYGELRLPIDEDTLLAEASSYQVTGLTDKVAGTDFYGAILTTLEEAAGFRRGMPGTRATAGERRYYVFTYDWRQDNVVSAKALDELIGQIRTDYGNPDLKVDVIAHSMGGLLTRYYVRYGTADVLDDNDFPVNNHGGERIRRVVLLGTPNLGSANAIRSFLEGVKLGFSSIRVQDLLTMPSVYQLLPHPINNWIVSAQGTPLNRDLFDAGTWRRFRWGIYDANIGQQIADEAGGGEAGGARVALLQSYFEKHIERARRFVWSLTIGLETASVDYIVFGGDCDMTPARILVEERKGESMVRLWPREVESMVDGVDYESLMLEPGDGTVTKASLLARESLDPTVPRHQYSFFPLDYAFFLCEHHERLTGNIHFQDNLLHALLSRDR